MFKNILLGLGSVGVVGGGGYMIYNATRSGDEGAKGSISESGSLAGTSGAAGGGGETNSTPTGQEDKNEEGSGEKVV